MDNGFVFSWAENAEGRMVHVDNVPRGLLCNCHCPYCQEPLMARHGDEREHGFAHQSKNRGANLDICYMVIMYKLAEQIIQTKKRIHAPSYYGIFPAQDLVFADVTVDGRFEREDNQPDVVAVTADGKQYLIEFTFANKIRHKKAIDYCNLSCIEIDLSKQNLETLEEFLLDKGDDRKWLNNENYFNAIVDRYHRDDKLVRIVSVEECTNCELKYSCCGVKSKQSQEPLVLDNSGERYRICKTEQYATELERLRLQKQELERLRAEELKRQKKQEEERSAQFENEQSLRNERRRQVDAEESMRDPSQRTCLDCQSNLVWANKNGMAGCAKGGTFDVPRKNDPAKAQTCPFFQRKI